VISGTPMARYDGRKKSRISPQYALNVIPDYPFSMQGFGIN
jgi:hypothetical protein